MNKQEIIDYMYENHVQGDFKIEEMAEDLAQPQWIPISERLPKYGHVVLWCNEYGSVFTSAITGYIGYSWHIGRKHWGADVVAWMPLPEPWGGDSDE